MDKYSPSMKEAVDRYNRHGEEFNALVNQQHPEHSEKRPKQLPDEADPV